MPNFIEVAPIGLYAQSGLKRLTTDQLRGRPLSTSALFRRGQKLRKKY